MRTIGTTSVDGEVRAVASGTLPSGQPVVVNADGTVSAAGIQSQSTAAGTPSVFESSESGANTCSTFDSNSNRVVVAYRDADNSGHGTALVGTVNTSNNSISFGTAVIFNAANGSQFGITFDSNVNKVVITYKDSGNSSKGTAIVGTVDPSDNSISFGSEAVFELGSTNSTSPAFDSSNNKVVIAYSDAGNSDKGKAVVGTISGTDITFGTIVQFEAGATDNISATFDSNSNKVVIAYRDNGNSSYGKAIVGTVSSTNISFGDEVVFETANSQFISTTFDSNVNKIVIAYYDGGNSGHGTAIVGTVSNTAITFGSAAVFKAATSQYTKVVFDSSTNNVIIAYQDGGNSGHGTVRTATVSGTGIGSFGTEVVFESASTESIQLSFDSTSNRAIATYFDGGNSGAATVSVIQGQGSVPNLTSENYIGMSRGPTSSTSATQAIGSTVDMQSNRGDYVCATYDSNSNKVVVAFSGDANGNAGKAIVGTVSGTSISFGTLAQFYSGRINGIGITFDSANNKVVVSYADVGNSSYGTAAVGTVSGTSISFGTPVVYNSGATGKQQAAFDPSSGKVVIAYIDDGDSSDGTAIVGTVSGTGISFGSEVDFNTGSLSNPTIVADTTNDKVVVSYKVGNFGKSRVGTVSGTSISFGTEATFVSAANYQKTSCFDSDTGKVFVAYRTDGGSNSAGVVGTVSGTDITFGTPVVFSTNSTAELYCCYNTAAKKVILTYEDATDSQKLKIVEGTISGTTVSFGSAIDSGSNSQISTPGIVYDSTQEVAVIAFRDSPAVGTDAFVFRSAFTQITRAEVASGSPATIDIGNAVSVNQLSLTAGQQYFVQTDGTIGLTADDPSVFAGTAVSATDIIVKG